MTEAAGGTDFYVVLKEGVQRVSKAVADMILYTPGIGGSNMSSVTPDVLQGLPQVTPGSPGYLDVEHYPDTVPTVLDPLQHPVSCLGWNIRGEGEQRDAFTSVYISSVLPVPSNPDGTPQVVKIGTPSPDGQKIDNFYMQPGYAAAVQGATTKDTFGRGSIQLISDRGVRYGVPNQDIAKGLGLTKLSPAPESIIKLLPTGPSLNLQDAQRTYDTVPVDAQAGAVIQPQEQAAPQGGN